MDVKSKKFSEQFQPLTFWAFKFTEYCPKIRRKDWERLFGKENGNSIIIALDQKNEGIT